MSIEQTNQLILLLLNSVLMTLLSSLLLGGAWLRQNALLQQLHKTRWQRPYEGRSHYRKLAHPSASSALPEQLTNPITSSHPSELQQSELKQLRDRRQQLSEQYQWSRIGMLMLNTTLLVFSVSLFALALRSLLNFDSLISAALFLFAIGAAGLLIGTGCILIDFAKGNTHNDSLGHTLANILQQLSHQWQRSSLKLAALKLDSMPVTSASRSASQNRPLTTKPTVKHPVKSSRPASKTPSQQISS